MSETRRFTLEELRPYDGVSNEKIYIAILVHNLASAGFSDSLTLPTPPSECPEFNLVLILLISPIECVCSA